MKKTIGVISLALILLASAFAAVPVFAKDLNIPSGARILYFSGGEAVVNLPTDPSLRVNYPSSATEMKIEAMHVEIPNAGMDSYGLLIQLYMIPLGATTQMWEPFAYITTSSDSVSLLKALWSGTFIEFPGPHYASSWVITDNVKLVSDDVLQVERQGNSISINLAASQRVQRPTGVYFTIPVFSLELNKYGGSIHTFETIPMTGWYDASGYTITVDNMGFNANGAFTSAAWGCNDVPVSDGMVTMHGIQTDYPPAT